MSGNYTLQKFSMGKPEAPTEVAWGFLSFKSIEPLRKPHLEMVLFQERGEAKILLHQLNGKGITLWHAHFSMFRLPAGKPEYQDILKWQKKMQEPGDISNIRREMLVPKFITPDWKRTGFYPSKTRLGHVFTRGKLALSVTYAVGGDQKKLKLLECPVFDWCNENLSFHEKSWCITLPAENKTANPKPSITDEPLPANMKKEIAGAIKRARKELQLDAKKTTPHDIQKAILATLKSLAAGRRLKPDAQQDYAINLGSLWGQTVCDELGWEWCQVKQGESGVFAVATPNRSHFVQPLHFMKRQINERGEDAEITSMLLFNMLKAGDLPPAKAKAYHSLG